MPEEISIRERHKENHDHQPIANDVQITLSEDQIKGVELINVYRPLPIGPFRPAGFRVHPERSLLSECVTESLRLEVGSRCPGRQAGPSGRREDRGRLARGSGDCSIAATGTPLEPELWRSGAAPRALPFACAGRAHGFRVKAPRGLCADLLDQRGLIGNVLWQAGALVMGSAASDGGFSRHERRGDREQGQG